MLKKIVQLFLILAFIACTDKDNPELIPAHSTTTYAVDIPPGFPTDLNIPNNNPMTIEGIELGRYLFYDTRLSGRVDEGKFMSCATCHIQEYSFECGIDHPEFSNGFTHGIDGEPTPHVMLPLINLIWNNSGYLWNGFVNSNNPLPNFRNIEDLVWMGIIAEHEMNSDTNKVKELFQQIPGYPELFEKAFGSEIVTVKDMGKAIAQFIRTLITANSKFDKYLHGDIQLTASELNGFVLFTTEEGADCMHCHGGSGNPLFTTNLFYNNGKDSLFTGEYEDPRDRYHVTNDPMDFGAYKAPTLRNIEFTAPYMHDGRYATLDEVIEFYSHHLVWSPYIDPLMHHIANGGTQLVQSEKDDLKAFLLTLSDTTFINNPVFSKPDRFPDE